MLKKKKIIITGGLGYIGTELCKLYSGVSWHHKILVIDNRFISERVSQLRNWNIEFVHGDILDKGIVEKYFKDADIIHHLAGVTDVPRVKSESTAEKDKKIKEVAEIGTQNIIDSISDNCKIIFPSTPSSTYITGILFIPVCLIRLDRIFFHPSSSEISLIT